MKVKCLIFLLVVLVVSGVAQGRPFTIIIVTSNDTSEQGYREFLQDIYRGNVDVQIRPDRYKEDLSAGKKAELQAADLITNSVTGYRVIRAIRILVLILPLRIRTM